MYWMMELMPLAVTALIPMVLFPLLGVQDTGMQRTEKSSLNLILKLFHFFMNGFIFAAKVSMNYMKETNMMFIGGLTIALAVEYCNLHRRIALKVMTTVGSSPRR